MDLIPQLASHHAAFSPPPDLFEAGLLVGFDACLPDSSSAKTSFRFRVISLYGRADRIGQSLEKGGPWALRPRLTTGLPFSQRRSALRTREVRRILLLQASVNRSSKKGV